LKKEKISDGDSEGYVEIVSLEGSMGVKYRIHWTYATC
jgi:hypothetical protein